MSKSREDLEGIAIGWLFFGTLAEVTRCSLDITNYLERDADGEQCLKLTSALLDTLFIRWHIVATHFGGSVYIRGSTDTSQFPDFTAVTTALSENRDGLQARIPTWQSDEDMVMPEVKLDVNGQSLQYERAHKCLTQSRAVIGFLSDSIDTMTVFVIATLHEFLAAALTLLTFRGEAATAYSPIGKYPIRQIPLGSWVSGPEFTHYNRNAVRDLGWCPRTAENMWREMTRTLALDFFAVNLKTHQSSEDHSGCSQDICLAYQLEAKDYLVIHTTEKCSCPFLGPDPDIASAVLNSGEDSIPLTTLFEHRGKDSVSVEVLDAASEEEYIAISHVWSHGLGNPRHNALPKCQLQRIQKMVNDLGSQVGLTNENVPFWIDTLCCPLTPRESRTAAILKMNETYKRASHVLVLDRNLTSLRAQDISKLEMLMQIYRTTWMTRLWTLPEAKFTKQLWFQFDDKAINLKQLHYQFANDRVRSISEVLLRQQFEAPLFARLNSLRVERLSVQIPVPQVVARVIGYSEASSRLSILCYCLGGRSTAWASDEAICIANLNGLDLSPILEVAADDPAAASLRMMAMWKQWPALPQMIIFSSNPRLSQKGYRWALSTLVRTHNSAFPLVDPPKDANIDPEGRDLMVTMPGFVLRSNQILLRMVENDGRLGNR